MATECRQGRIYDRSNRVIDAFSIRSLLLCGVLAGCTDGTGPSAMKVLVDPTHFLPEARAFIENGSFIFPQPAWRFTSPARRDSLLTAVAGSLRDFAAIGGTSIWEEQHGGLIHWATLHSCGGPVYSLSPIPPLPTSYPQLVKARYAAFWIGFLCPADDAREVNVALTDEQSLFEIDGSRLKVPWSNGTELEIWGTYSSSDRGLPTSAEQAANFAYSRLNTLIASLPQAWRWWYQGVTQYPIHCMLWRISLAEPRGFRSANGTVRTTSDVYVARTPTCANGALAFWLPSEPQPTTFAIDTGSSGSSMVTVNLVAPIVFELVTPSP